MNFCCCMSVAPFFNVAVFNFSFTVNMVSFAQMRLTIFRELIADDHLMPLMIYGFSVIFYKRFTGFKTKMTHAFAPFKIAQTDGTVYKTDKNNFVDGQYIDF